MMGTEIQNQIKFNLTPSFYVVIYLIVFLRILNHPQRTPKVEALLNRFVQPNNNVKKEI